ncbi:MAG: DNA polymerase III subunit delta [Flavobacteriales bacterium]|nr:DNA polymerase III subunit delta [Flavobacteriales bacterium]
MNYKEIISSIANKDLQPVYFLMGDEPYYIDKLADLFSKNILSAEEQEFNQVVLYGKDIETAQIIAEAKQFPFGSEKRVVIIREAQHLKDIDLLDSYLDNVQPSTLLVICYKGKSVDKRKKFGKTLAKKCVVFESKKLYDNKIPAWINTYVTENGFKIDNSATAVLAEYIGADLSKITNELDKLMLVVKKEEQITTKLIEYHIGISKDYNVFELQNALGKKQVVKANRIINHFAANPKNHNIVPVMSALFSYFQKIMVYHFLEDKSPKFAASVLKVNPFFVSQYQTAAQNYSKRQLFYIFEHLKDYDLKSKGVNNKSTSHEGLLKELIFKILHA